MSLALAIDVGGTKVDAALVDERGIVLSESRHRESTGPSKSAEELAVAVTAVMNRARESLPENAIIAGIGIGAAGPINERDGRISPLNLPAWRDYPLREFVAASAGGYPVTLRMDGLCITLAEHWVGAAQGYENVMGMVVSTGIGGGLILGGNTVSGPTGNAGHIGHVEVAGFDEECACGGVGCVEAIASGPRTVAWARSQGWTGSTGEQLAASYLTGDKIAVAAIERSGRAIGQAISSATALLDLDIVAIGGGFSQVSPDLFGHIRAAICRRDQFGFVTKVRIVPSGLSADGPLIGAAALVHRAELVA